MEEYLTTQELSVRIKMAPGTIRNLVCQKKLIENVHYIKPTPRKLLFLWSRVEHWLMGSADPGRTDHKQQSGSRSLINI